VWPCLPSPQPSPHLPRRLGGPTDARRPGHRRPHPAAAAAGLLGAALLPLLGAALAGQQHAGGGERVIDEVGGAQQAVDARRVALGVGQQAVKQAAGTWVGGACVCRCVCGLCACACV
jgi:hypothetical protein